jgi:regulator of replication initiation timing
MQGKLLAKVEELTLHMIQAEERSKKLEVENRDLRDRIGRLESRGATVTKPHGDMAAEQTEAQ